MIQTYNDTRDAMRKKLAQMKKEIEDFYTVKELVGKRVHVTGMDDRDGKPKDFYAYYMGVNLDTLREAYLEIIFKKQWYLDHSEMIDERDFRLTRWNDTIVMRLAPVQPKRKGLDTNCKVKITL